MNGDIAPLLETIDNALADWSVSNDAMRWTAEPPAVTPIPTPRQMQSWPRLRVEFAADVTAFAAAMIEVGKAVEHLMPVMVRFRLSTQRRRSRIVTNRKRKGWR